MIEVRKDVLKKIAKKLSIRHIGYYTFLCAFGPDNPANMAKKTGLSVGQCRKVEKDLEDIGAIYIEGVGKKRRVIIVEHTGDKDAETVLGYFVEKTNKFLEGSSSWHQRQYKIAQDMAKKYGVEACVFMIDYLVDVEKVDVYSLALLDYAAGDLMPKYQRAKSSREKLASEEKEVWDLEIKTEPEESDELPDLGSLFNYGIQL